MRNIILALAVAVGLSLFTIGCVALPAASPAPVCCDWQEEGVGSIRATGPITGTSGTFTSTLNVTGRTTTGGLTSSQTITGTNAVLTGTLGVTGRTTTGGLTSSGTITGTNAVLTGTLDVQGSTSFAKAAILSQTTITATDGITITPTYNVYKLNSAGAVAIGLEPCSGQGGYPLYLYGLDNNTITISDTNVLTTDGNAATLGQYDVVGWLCNGTNWVHLFKSANQ